MASQVERRAKLAGGPYEHLPEVDPTTPVEDAVNELYTLGFQATADLAQALFQTLSKLDAFCLADDPKGRIQGLSTEETVNHEAWQVVETRVKTELMDIGLRDEGSDRLAPEGTLTPNYLRDQFLTALSGIQSDIRLTEMTSTPKST